MFQSTAYHKDLGKIKGRILKDFSCSVTYEDFIESHTGLEDCEIEKDILIYCLQKNPPRKKLWEN